MLVSKYIPQICTVILRICIGKVACFAVYICGNLWTTRCIHTVLIPASYLLDKSRILRRVELEVGSVLVGEIPIGTPSSLKSPDFHDFSLAELCHVFVDWAVFGRKCASLAGTGTG